MLSSRSLIRGQSGFTLIELIVGMAIFSISMTGILLLLHTTIENSWYSRHETVIANLLREQVELVKNMRNTNVRNYTDFDRISYDNSGTGSNILLSPGTYIVENNFAQTGFAYTTPNSPVSLSGITLSCTDPDEQKQLECRFNTSRLYLDSKKRYTHASTSSGTEYATYMIVSPLAYTSGGTSVPIYRDVSGTGGWILDARTIVRSKNRYKEYDLKTLITNWNR